MTRNGVNDGTLVDQPALPNDPDPVCCQLDLGKDVGGKENQAAPASFAAEDIAHLANAMRIKAGHRLVKDEHRGVVKQGAGQAELLLQALGKIDGTVAGAISQADIGERIRDPRLGWAT